MKRFVPGGLAGAVVGYLVHLAPVPLWVALAAGLATALCVWYPRITETAMEWGAELLTFWRT